MIRFVPTSASAAVPLTEALWGLSRPTEVRGARDTRAMFAIVTATDASVWLMVDTEFDIPVHQDAVLNGIADVLQPWIDEGVLPADTNATLAAFIQSKQGQRMIPWEAFPQLFKDLSKTYAEMIAAGLLAEPAMP